MARGSTQQRQPLGIEAQLWRSADALRSNMDASEYKHVVLGLIFLKYISDSFEERRSELEAATRDPTTERFCDSETDRQAVLEDRDEYTAMNVFWVPAEARWQRLRDAAKQPTIGRLIDDAMVAIERDNPTLKGVLPKDYARPTLDWQRLGQLVDLIGAIGVGGAEARNQDLLGRVYEYFLAQFASAEGKGGGEFYTPASVVGLLVEMLEPYRGRVFDPCCGSGGMFVQSVRFIEAHGGRRSALSVYGQESNPTTWRLCAMNLAIRGIEANLGGEAKDSFRKDLHPDLRADYILANPPFNVSDWSGELLRDDVRWKFGVPPVGNANYAWIQHFAHHLAPEGRAGFVLANGALTAKTGGEDAIRASLIDADQVECLVSLPGKLFYTRQLPVSLWFLSRTKTGPATRDRRGRVLFIDARNLGHLLDRTHRDLSDDDIEAIAGAYHRWRDPEALYEDVPGFCAAVRIEDVRAKGYSLKPNLYVGAGADTVNEAPDTRALAIIDERTLGEPLIVELESRLRSALGGFSGLLQGEAPTDEELPVGWSWSTVRDVTGYVSRGISPSYIDAGGVAVLNQKCVRAGRIDFTKARRHDAAQRSVEGREIQDADILINSTGVGTLGRVAQVVRSPERAIADSHLTIVRPDPAKVDPFYLGAYLLGRQAEIEELGEGTTGQTELSKQQILAYPVLLAPSEIQNLVGSLAARMAQVIDALDVSRQQLVSLLSNIYPALAFGQLGGLPESTQSDGDQLAASVGVDA